MWRLFESLSVLLKVKCSKSVFLERGHLFLTFESETTLHRLCSLSKLSKKSAAKFIYSNSLLLACLPCIPVINIMKTHCFFNLFASTVILDTMDLFQDNRANKSRSVTLSSTKLRWPMARNICTCGHVNNILNCLHSNMWKLSQITIKYILQVQ